MTTTEAVRWSVHCGCPGHGDHLACEKGCRDYGCTHPRGLSISHPDEETAVALSGQEPPAELVRYAANEELDRLSRVANRLQRRINRLEAYVATL